MQSRMVNTNFNLLAKLKILVMGGSAELGTSIICKHLKVTSFHSILIVDRIHETIKKLFNLKGWKSHDLNLIKRKRLDKKKDILMVIHPI